MTQRYVPLAKGVHREFVVRASRTPSGSQEITVFIRWADQMAQVDRITADARSFTASEVEGILSSLTDAFMRELVITNGVQLQVVSMGD